MYSQLCFGVRLGLVQFMVQARTWYLQVADGLRVGTLIRPSAVLQVLLDVAAARFPRLLEQNVSQALLRLRLPLNHAFMARSASCRRCAWFPVSGS